MSTGKWEYKVPVSLAYQPGNIVSPYPVVRYTRKNCPTPPIRPPSSLRETVLSIYSARLSWLSH